MSQERAVIFEVAGESLLGILHTGASNMRTGVLIVVGGPQYRVGSHRQFLLLARHLATAGIPAFRFDYRGMGDASGELRDFEDVSEDLTAALDHFQALCPGVERIVVWGLCDAASAALLHLSDDPRVSGMVLANPWVRTEQGLARAHLKHYYVRRIMSRNFWSGLVRGRLNPFVLLRSLLQTASAARKTAAPDKAVPLAPLPVRMARGWAAFQGEILLIISGADLTAAEFIDAAHRLPEWRGLLLQDNVTRLDMAEANHTFSRTQWRNQVARSTADWILKKEKPAARETPAGKANQTSISTTSG